MDDRPPPTEPEVPAADRSRPDGPSAASDDPHGPAAADGDRRQSHGLSDRIARLRRSDAFVAAVAVVGFVAALATFVDNLDRVVGWTEPLWRQVVPLPTPTPTPPLDVEGVFTEVRLGAPNVSLAEVYRDRPDLDPERDDVSRQDLAQRGQLVAFRVEFRGLLGRRCVIKWSLYDATTNERAVDPSGYWETSHVLGWPDRGWIVEALGREVEEGEVWVPYLEPGRYVVELELYDDRDTRLDTQRPQDAAGNDLAFEVPS